MSECNCSKGCRCRSLRRELSEKEKKIDKLLFTISSIKKLLLKTD